LRSLGILYTYCNTLSGTFQTPSKGRTVLFTSTFQVVQRLSHLIAGLGQEWVRRPARPTWRPSCPICWIVASCATTAPTSPGESRSAPGRVRCPTLHRRRSPTARTERIGAAGKQSFSCTNQLKQGDGEADQNFPFDRLRPRQHDHQQPGEEEEQGLPPNGGGGKGERPGPALLLELGDRRFGGDQETPRGVAGGASAPWSPPRLRGHSPSSRFAARASGRSARSALQGQAVGDHPKPMNKSVCRRTCQDSQPR
jgi:hypothetical protein